MTAARLALGRRGEDLAAAELRRLGWDVLARNARPAGMRGELDIVARDGGELVFVEVKSGRAGARSGPVSPLEMVGREKRRRLRLLAGAWAAQHREEIPRSSGMRIDVIAIRLDGAGRVCEWDHVRGV